MKHHIRSFTLFLLFFFIAASFIPVNAQPAAKKFDLKILYAGVPGSVREKDFVEFLSKHFKQVKSEGYAKLEESSVKPFDVVIIDAVNDDFKIEIPAFIKDYSKPTILMSFKAAGIVYEALSEKNKTGGYM